MKNQELNVNEKYLLKSLYEFFPPKNDSHEKNRKSLYNLTINHELNQVLAAAIVKYMLHEEHLSPYEVETLIRRYMVVFIYAFIKSKTKNFEFIVPHFEKLLNDGIDTKGLRIDDFEDINVFTSLYLKRDKTKYQSYCKDFKELVTSLNILNDKKIETLYNIVRKDNKYFLKTRNKFDSLYRYYARNYDEMIAETLVDDEFFKYKIFIDEEYSEAFNSNFVESNSKANLKPIRQMIFGYLVYDAMKKDNLNFNRPVSLIQSKDLKLLLRNPEAKSLSKDGISVLKFIEVDLNNNYRVKKGLIKPFNFVYNDKEYSFNEEGIKLIK